MQITKIARSYTRTIEYKKPDGSSLWLKHEASIEAIPDDPGNSEAVRLASCTAMDEAMTAVGESIKEEKQKLDAMFKKQEEPFDGDVPTVRSMPKI